MASTTSDERPLRFCDACMGLDDHPRHTIYNVRSAPTADQVARLPKNAPREAVDRLLDPSSSLRHIDCCAAAGCPLCAESERITAGARGGDLVELLAVQRVTKDIDETEHAFDPQVLVEGGLSNG